MEDRDVGKMWDYFRNNGFWLNNAPSDLKDVLNLIRKLVEERAWKLALIYYKSALLDDKDQATCIKAALRDFGIDPETFKEGK